MFGYIQKLRQHHTGPLGAERGYALIRNKGKPKDNTTVFLEKKHKRDCTKQYTIINRSNKEVDRNPKTGTNDTNDYYYYV